MKQQVLEKLKLTQDKPHSQTIKSKLHERQSKELVIAFCGPIGVDITRAKRIFSETLDLAGYRVETIKISDGLPELIEKIKVFPDTTNSDFIEEFSFLRNKFKEIERLSGFKKYKLKQDAGNLLRRIEDSVLGQYASKEIWEKRLDISEPDFKKYKKQNPGQTINEEEFVTDYYIPQKTVYFVDQLKHPSETELLGQIYRQSFYQIGLFSTINNRREFLKEKQLNHSQITKLMERDKREFAYHGQQLQKTLMLSDYFIKTSDEDNNLKKEVTRFIDLIHGRNSITPRRDETAMDAAYSAALGSACLSRQVGASITNTNGKVISTGCNDVPKSGGGLYSLDSPKDNRCFNYKGGKCFNDKEKLKIRSKVQNIISKTTGLRPGQLEKVTDKIYEGAGLREITEYSRAIHAEMAAVLNVAREGGVPLQQCTMYVTTFPCHSCARHLVAAGIKKVVFIEPYEKSKAIDLHGDSTTIGLQSDGNDKMIFDHFEGVAPRRYQYLFKSMKRKDDNGN